MSSYPVPLGNFSFFDQNVSGKVYDIFLANPASIQISALQKVTLLVVMTISPGGGGLPAVISHCAPWCLLWYASK